MMQNKKGIFCPKCGQYKNNRPVTVDSLIVKNNKILLVKRSGYPYKDYWALPGGFVDRDETVEEAVCRETYEETGLTVIFLKLLGVYSSPDRHPKQLIAVLFFVKFTGVPKPGDDAAECKFFPLDSLPLPLAFDHEKMIKDYLGRKNESPR